MILEIRTYSLKPGTMNQYLKLYEAEGFDVQKRTLGGFVGSFVTEVGALNQIVHLWAYRDMDERMTRRAKLSADPIWQAAVAKFISCFVDQESRVLLPTSRTDMLAAYLPAE